MTPWVKRLLIANLVVFALTSAYPALRFQLAFFPAYMLYRPWTLITYMFVHAPGFWHIGFNMLMLFFFGPRLEARLGSRSFLKLYLISGLGGALLSLLTPRVAIIGASGAIYGIFFAFAWFWPRERIHIWGVLPVEARSLVILGAVAAIVLGFGPLVGLIQGGGIAHFAHLGGFVGGFLYLKWRERFSGAARFKAKVESAPRRVSGADVQRWSSIRRDGLHPLNREELERLLAKIERQGASSLTDDEKRFLERLAPP